MIYVLGTLKTLTRATLPVLREGRAHHPGLSGSAKRPGSLGGGVLVSRTDIIPPSGGTNNLFPASLAWGLESLSVGALLDSGADECLIDMTLARQAGIPLEPMETTLSAQALDDHSLGKISHRTTPLSLTLSGDHVEIIQLLMIHAPHGTTGLGQTIVRQARPPCLLVHWADSGLERVLSRQLPAFSLVSAQQDQTLTPSARPHWNTLHLS